MIPRRTESEINGALTYFPVISIIGPRQVGKTTLAKQIMSASVKPTLYLDLEIQSDLFKLNDAELFLSGHSDHLIVIDEVQNKKELYPLLRGLVDQQREPARFLLLGSASPVLIRNYSESLAGRIAYHQPYPFDVTEIPDNLPQTDLWVKVGFPDMLFNPNIDLSHRWMERFIKKPSSVSSEHIQAFG